MSLPAMRHLTLFEAQVIAIPMVKRADPHKIVLLLPKASARKRPVRRLPAKAPAWMEAVIPPCNPFDGELGAVQLEELSGDGVGCTHWKKLLN